MEKINENLIDAARRGNNELLRVLILKKADIDYFFETVDAIEIEMKQ